MIYRYILVFIITGYQVSMCQDGITKETNNNIVRYESALFIRFVDLAKNLHATYNKKNKIYHNELKDNIFDQGLSFSIVWYGENDYCEMQRRFYKSPRNEIGEQ